MHGCNGQSYGKIPKMIATVTDIMSKGVVDMTLLALNWYLIHPYYYNRVTELFCIFRLTLSIDFCQPTLSPQLIFLCMITHSLLNQHHTLLHCHHFTQLYSTITEDLH